MHQHGQDHPVVARPILPILLVLLAATGIFLDGPSAAVAESLEKVPGPFVQDAYVWQRSWGEATRTAVQQHRDAFRALVLLKAEVTWKGKIPNVVNVPIDYAAVQGDEKPVGLALRIGAYSGPFLRDDAVAKTLVELAHSIVAESRSHGLRLQELQLDFDCAASKLGGYAIWIGAIRSAIAPVPLSITVLPSWLDRTGFKELISGTDGYVLQVHSLERPKDFDAPIILCDPGSARAAVTRAGAFQVPFRVALPTYGYFLAFDQASKFVGLSAEGPIRSWPKSTRVREVRSDPQAIAALVQTWATNRPACLQGLIWYRLPVPGDILNWHWPTLGAIIALRSPHASMRADSRRVEPGLIEISLVNDGELDISSRLAVEVRWPHDAGARLLAADGLRGFEVADQRVFGLRLESRLFRLPAGEQQVIGWVRLSQDREVQVEWKEF